MSADGETAQSVVDELRDTAFIVSKIHRREKKRYPVPPFITSNLQQEAARRLNYPGQANDGPGAKAV